MNGTFLNEDYDVENDFFESDNILPEELFFINDIESEFDIENLSLQKLYFLLEESKKYLSEEDYNHTESRIIELDKNEMPLDDSTIYNLYSVINTLIRKYNT